jgi:type IV pilus assembly protein PilB
VTPCIIELDEFAATSAPVRKLVEMLLLIAIKGGASELHFGHRDEIHFEVWLKHTGQYCEMVPPPVHLAGAIVNVIKVMAELDRPRPKRQLQGLVRFEVGGAEVPALVVIGRSWFGERAAVYLFPPPRTASSAARELLNTYASNGSTKLLDRFDLDEGEPIDFD